MPSKVWVMWASACLSITLGSQNRRGHCKGMKSEIHKLLDKGSVLSWPSCSAGTLIAGGVFPCSSLAHSHVDPTLWTMTVVSLILCRTQLQHGMETLHSGFASSSAEFPAAHFQDRIKGHAILQYLRIED